MTETHDPEITHGTTTRTQTTMVDLTHGIEVITMIGQIQGAEMTIITKTITIEIGPLPGITTKDVTTMTEVETDPRAMIDVTDGITAILIDQIIIMQTMATGQTVGTVKIDKDHIAATGDATTVATIIIITETTQTHKSNLVLVRTINQYLWLMV